MEGCNMGTNNRPELVEKLTEGIRSLTTSDDWLRYLDYQSRFHSYSFNNVLLIAAQKADASRIAGFRAWQRMNRFVRKGEKAIYILAPMIYKQAEESTDSAERVIRGFKYVAVFDVSQTDGEELPSPCQRLDGADTAGYYGELVAVANSIGFTVEDAELAGSTNGDCSHELRRIRVEVTNSPIQRVKTLAHEIAHAILHEMFEDRAIAELEAESTAYVVCQALGIDSSDYSFGYVANWAGGGDEAVAAVKAVGERIQRAAEHILDGIIGDKRAAA
jgi:antirestriction protein ArdC